MNNSTSHVQTVNAAEQYERFVIIQKSDSKEIEVRKKSPENSCVQSANGPRWSEKYVLDDLIVQACADSG